MFSPLATTVEGGGPVWPTLVAFGAFMLVAQFSPGPDMLLLMKNALNHSRRAALLTVVGIAVGLTVHCSVILGGLALMLERSPWTHTWIQRLGGLYLCWLAVKLLRSLRRETAGGVALHRVTPLADGAAFSQGLFTNLLNAKAILFLVATLARFHHAGSPPWMAWALGGIVIGQALLFWALFVLALQWTPVRTIFLRHQFGMNALFGALLLVAGLSAAIRE